MSIKNWLNNVFFEPLLIVPSFMRMLMPGTSKNFAISFCIVILADAAINDYIISFFVPFIASIA